MTSIAERDNTARGSHCQRHNQTSIPDHLGFYSLRSVLDELIKRSFAPGQASRCKLRVYCDGFHWVNKTFTSVRSAQHPFVGTFSWYL